MKLGFDPKLALLKLRRALQPVTRHHVIIAFVLVVGMLIAAIFTVNSILTAPTDQAYLTQQQTEGVKTHFDEATITNRDLRYRAQDRKSLSLPPGRINPFAE